MQINPSPDFRLLFENLPGLHLVLSPDYTIIAASESYLEATMIKREEVMGQNMFDVFPDNPADEHADGSANLRASLNHVVEHLEPHQMAIQRYDVRRPDGVFEERIWLLLNTPILNAAGELCCILHYAEDVTEKQKKLKQIDFLSLQIDKSHDAIYTVDNQLRINNWNYGAEQLYGYTKEEVIGKNPNVLLQTELSQEELYQLENSVNSQDYQTGEFKRRTKSGKEIWVQFSISTIRDNGILIGYVVVSFNITEKKQLHDQVDHLARIVENSSEAIFSRSTDMRIMSWNKGAEKLFGFSKEDVIGKDARELGFFQLSPDAIAQVEAEIRRTNTWISELTFKHKSGAPFYGTVTGNSVRNEKGEITSFYFIVKDISLHKKLEEHLTKSNQELEDRVKERTATLEASEKKYHYLFDNNPLPMWVIDRETYRFLAVNETAIVHYGYSREDFLSMTAFDIRPDADKEAFLRIDRKRYSHSSIHDAGIWNHVKKDGTVIQVKINAHYIIFGEKHASLVLINDVTETLEAEEKLKASERRFRTLIEKANDIIVLIDASFNLIYRSPAAERIVGWTNEDLLNSNAMHNIHPDDMDKAIEVQRQVLENPGVPFKLKFRNKHKNGHYIWLEGVLTNLLHNEDVRAIVSNYQDVTETVQAEEKLQASEKRFRTLIEKANDVITLMDSSFKLIYRSPAAERITGWSNEEMLQVEATHNIHPDDLAEARHIVEQVMANPGVTFKTLFRNHHKNGHYIWMEGSLTNWLQDENVKAIVFNYQDVTERITAAEKIAASEERFRSTLDDMIEGVQIIGFDWKYIFVNKAFAKQARCMPEALTGFPVFEKFSCLEQHEIYKVCQRCFSERIPIQMESEFTFPDNTTGWYELSLQPVPEGVFILSVDITERKRTEAALEAERAKLDKIAATAPGLIYSFHMDNKGEFSFPYASNAVEDIFGFSFSEIKNDAYKVLVRARPEEVEKLVSSIEYSAKELSPWSYEYQYDHPVKGKIWLYGNSIPGRQADGSILWHGIISDITNLKNAEQELTISKERFQYATKASSDIVWELNFETGEYVVYEGREKLFGPDVQINWQTGVEGNYIVEKDRERIRASFSKARHDINQELWSDEYEVYATDGSILKVMNHAIFIRNSNREVTRVIGAMKDITQQRKLEHELQEQQRKEQQMITATTLEAQEKERNAIGMELHDNVNQILVGAYMMLRLAASNSPKREELINTGIEHVKSAIDENRKLAHELVAPDIATESLPALLTALTNTTLVNAGLKVHIDASQCKDCMLNDKLKLAIYRVAQEQCSNIIKYAQAQQVSFNLSIHRNTFSMQVIDDGVGMHMKPGIKPAGIGLRNIAARMSVFNGKMDIESQLGKGFKMTVKIPLAKQKS